MAKPLSASGKSLTGEYTLKYSTLESGNCVCTCTVTAIFIIPQNKEYQMIETERLIINPLSLNELIRHIKSSVELAKDLGLKPSKSLIDKETQEAILNDLLPGLSDLSKDPLFYTMWIIIEKNEKAIIGGICFHGEPDNNGEVEIGYGIDSDYRNKGYMTDTISGFIEWIGNRDDIRTIKAITDKTNLASIRVMIKNNFFISEQDENSVTMKFEITKHGCQGGISH